MKTNPKIPIGLFIVMLLATIGFRYQLLLLFGFEYTDSDQVIMWSALKDFLNGEFHEPRFYGQNYNTMLEALLATPLYKFGVPAYKAVTMITTLLTLFPFWLLSWITFKKKSPAVGLMILSIPFLMPTEYHLITTLSRGFVTGIFIASFGTLALFYRDKKWAFFLLAFSSIMGYSVSANAALACLPCILYVSFLNSKNPSFYIYSAMGLAVGGGLHFLADYFYTLHPNYNIHKFKLIYSFDLLIKSLGTLDSFFNAVSPIFWKQGFVWMPIFLLCGIVLTWKRKLALGLSLIIIPILFILPLGFSKIHDGSNSIFFSSSRMYLSLPFVIAICISWINKVKINYFIFVIPFLFLGYNSMNLEAAVERNVNQKRKHIIAVAEIDNLIRVCGKINKICAANQVDLVVIVNHFYYDFFNYGCQMCTKGFPKTLRPSYERRTWRLLEDEQLVYNNILLIDDTYKLDEKFDFVERIDFNKFIVRNNHLPTMELFDKMDIPIRPYKLN